MIILHVEISSYGELLGGISGVKWVSGMQTGGTPSRQSGGPLSPGGECFAPYSVELLHKTWRTMHTQWTTRAPLGAHSPRETTAGDQIQEIYHASISWRTWRRHSSASSVWSSMKLCLRQDMICSSMLTKREPNRLEPCRARGDQRQPAHTFLCRCRLGLVSFTGITLRA